MNAFLRLALLALFLMGVRCLDAAVLVQYDFYDSGTFLQPGSAPGVSALPFASGNGLNIKQTVVTGVPPGALYVVGADVGTAISANDWVGFSISAAPGQVLDLAALHFYYVYNGDADATGTVATFQVRSSLDDFANPLATYTANLLVGSAPSSAQHSFTGPLDLSGSAFQGLSDIEFRIYLAKSYTGTRTNWLRLDAVALEGVLAPIPEPSASQMALAGFLIAGLWFGRKARCSQKALP